MREMLGALEEIADRRPPGRFVMKGPRYGRSAVFTIYRGSLRTAEERAFYRGGCSTACVEFDAGGSHRSRNQ